MAHPVLDEFGRRLMREVRDETIADWRMIIDGRMKGERAERTRRLIEMSDPDALKTIIPEVVDSVIHHLLRWLEEDKDFRISGGVDSCQSSHVADESDGLSGELYSDQGWIARFSKES